MHTALDAVSAPPHRSGARRTPAPNPVTEEVLVERARQGDLRAWEMIVRNGQVTTWRLAFLLTHDADAATDTASTAFVRAYRALPALARGQPLRPWLLGIVSTAVRAQQRSLMSDRDTRRFERTVGPHPSGTWVAGWPGSGALPPDLRDEIAATFGRLSWDDRLTIAARYLVRLPRDEAAALLSIEPAGVDEHLRAALARLRARLVDRRLAAVSPDRLGWLAITAVLLDAPWTPDIAPGVTDRLVRDVIAYPEQFARSPRSEPRTVASESAQAVGSATSSPPPTRGAPRRVRIHSTRLGALAVVAVGMVVVVAGTGGLTDLGDRDSRPAALPGPDTALVLEGSGVPGSSAGESLPAAANVSDVALRPRLSIASGGVIGLGGDGIQVAVDPGAGASIGTNDGPVVQRRIGDGRWLTLETPVGANTPLASLVAGRRYAFRVLSRDEDGSTASSRALRTSVVLRDSDSPRVEASASDRMRLPDAIGGSVLVLNQGSRLTTSFIGRGVAVVSPVDPTSGLLTVRLSGQPPRTQELAAPERSARRIVLSYGLDPGPYTLELGASGGSVAVDAVLILR